MPKNLRKKFKAVSSETAKKIREQEDEIDKEVQLGSGGTDYLDIVVGWNTFRLAPSHDPENYSFMQKRVRYWLPVKKDDGDMGRTPIPSAILHAPEDVGRDPVDLYLRLVKEKLDNKELTTTQIKAAKTILSGKQKSTADIKWVCYAWKYSKKEDGGHDKKFGILEFGKLIRNGIMDEVADDDEDDEITIDPFTDCDEGVLLKIRRDAENSMDMYKVKNTGRKAKLTDDQLEFLDKKDALHEIYGRGSYTQENFEDAVKGLELLDSTSKLGIFDEEDFQEELAEIEDLITKHCSTGEEADEEHDPDDDIDGDEGYEDEEPARKKAIPRRKGVKKKRFLKK